MVGAEALQSLARMLGVSSKWGRGAYVAAERLHFMRHGVPVFIFSRPTFHGRYESLSPFDIPALWDARETIEVGGVGVPVLPCERKLMLAVVLEQRTRVELLQGHFAQYGFDNRLLVRLLREGRVEKDTEEAVWAVVEGRASSPSTPGHCRKHSGRCYTRTVCTSTHISHEGKPMASTTSVVTLQRFATGMTSFKDWMAAIGQRQTEFQRHYDGFQLSSKTPLFTKLVADRGVKALVIGEDWCPDVWRGLPVMSKVAEASGMEVRYFMRDQNKGIMAEFLEKGNRVHPDRRLLRWQPQLPRPLDRAREAHR